MIKTINSISDFLKKYETKSIPNFKYYTYGYQENYRKVENVCLGYVPFLGNFGFEEKENIIPDTNPNNRCGMERESTEYIVIHDTASAAPSAGREAHSNWLMSMATNKDSTYSVSWHFTVDDSGWIQHLPIDEVGYHAGDGTKVKLQFINTNIKYDKEIGIKVAISKDGFFEVNGIVTKIEVPKDDEGKIVSNDKLPYLGINTIVDKDNNILLSNTYFNSGYKILSNKGGNLNSVGIETCVNSGHDYIKTMRITAYLVGKILVHYGLDIDRVKQHNSFSGKDCPMTIRKANLWEEFIDLVELNVFYLTMLNNHEVKFGTLDPAYLSSDGTIIKYKESKEISFFIEIDNEKHIFQTKLGKKEF